MGTSTTRLDGNWIHTNYADKVYLRSDVKKVKEEYMTLISQPSTTQATVDAWMSEKRRVGTDFRNRCVDMENFERQELAKQPRYRSERADYFAEKAATLDPPLCEEALQLMVPFKKTLESNRVPSEQGWKALKPKLLPIQSAAEELYRLVSSQTRYTIQQENRNIAPDDKYVPEDINIYKKLRQARSLEANADLRDEQKYVLRLARAQLTSYLVNGCAETDLVLLVLIGVYRKHAQNTAEGTVPQGLNRDGTIGVYQLTMDDTRLVVNKVIAPTVSRWTDPARVKKVLESFRCMACPRKDCLTCYEFEPLFAHIYEKHAKQVNQSDDYHTMYRIFDAPSIRNFPWYAVPWPQKLPVAARHHEVNRQTFWKPDADDEYQVAAPVPQSIFNNRTLYNNRDLKDEDFVGQLKYAAEELKKTTLGALLQFKIAFMYALHHYDISGMTEELSLDVLKEWAEKIGEENAQFMKAIFRCRVCHHHADVKNPRLKPEKLLKLIGHFDQAHTDQSFEWRNDMIEFPTHEEIAGIIKNTDDKLASDLAAGEKRQATLAKNPQKKPDPRFKILQEKLPTIVVIDHLFPPQQGGARAGVLGDDDWDTDDGADAMDWDAVVANSAGAKPTGATTTGATTTGNQDDDDENALFYSDNQV